MLSAGRLLISTAIVSSLVLLPASSPGALMSVGDIAFVGYNTDGSDDFAVVLLADASPSDVVRFNDNEWTGTTFNASNEGELSWTVGTSLAAGTVVTFSSVRTSPAASVGSLAGGTMSLSNAETIYAFLGTDAETPQTFLAAVSNSQNHYTGPTATLAGTGLTQGSTAVLLPASGTTLARGGQYKDTPAHRTGQDEFSDYLDLIGNSSANWDVSTSSGLAFVPFSTTPFEAASASVPEPGSLTLMMLVAMIGLMRYRFGAGNRGASSGSHE